MEGSVGEAPEVEAPAEGDLEGIEELEHGSGWLPLDDEPVENWFKEVFAPSDPPAPSEKGE